MTVYRDQVLGAVTALRVESARAYAWFGRTFCPRDGQATRAALGRRLYTHFYCLGGATPHVGPPDPVPSVGTGRFVRSLSEANAGRGGWQPGWRLVGEDGGALVLERDGLRLWAPRPDVDIDGRGGEAAVRRTKERLGAMPGYYLALGDATEGPPSPEVRFYLNVTSDGAPDLIGALTRRLNGCETPFRLKVLTDPRAFIRCDAAVLYVADLQRSLVEPHVLEVAARLGPKLLRRVPALTLPLAPGVGFAEDPGGGESFGTSRCDLLAVAAERAFELGATSLEDRLALVEAQFADAGADLDRPFLRSPADGAAAVAP